MNNFYKTVFTVTVLSERFPMNELSLKDLDYQITEGDGVGDIKAEADEISPQEVAALCRRFNSDPSFFGLDDEGKETDVD